jgi:hypothetical protein
MEPNLAGSIYERSSIKLLHLVPFGQQTWPPRLNLFSDWLMLKKSSLLPIRNKNCPWRPYLLVERNEMEKLYRGPYIDAYCQVWFHLVKLFQRRLKYEKVNGQTTNAK